MDKLKLILADILANMTAVNPVPRDTSGDLRDFIIALLVAVPALYLYLRNRTKHERLARAMDDQELADMVGEELYYGSTQSPYVLEYDRREAARAEGLHGLSTGGGA